jgi:hypothetical protein
VGVCVSTIKARDRQKIKIKKLKKSVLTHYG